MALGTGSAPLLAEAMMRTADPLVRLRFESCFEVMVKPYLQAWRSSVSSGEQSGGRPDREIFERLQQLGAPAWPFFRELMECAPVAIAREAEKVLQNAALDLSFPVPEAQFAAQHYSLAPVLPFCRVTEAEGYFRRHLALTLIDFARGPWRMKRRAVYEFCMIGAPADKFLSDTETVNSLLRDQGGSLALSPVELRQLREKVRWRTWPDLCAESGLDMSAWDELSLREKLQQVSLWHHIAGEKAVPVLRSIRHRTGHKALKERAELALFRLDALRDTGGMTPFSQAVLVHLAKLARERGRVMEALGYLREGYNKNPDDFITRYELAYTLLFVNAFSVSLSHFSEALKLGGSPYLITDYADKLRESCGNEKAVAYLEPLIEEHRRNRMLIHELAMTCLLAGRHESAISWFTKSLALAGEGQDRLDILTWYNLACAYALSGKSVPAVDALRKAVEKGWNDTVHMNEDRDLDSLRSLPAFKRLLEQLKRKTEEGEETEKPEGG